MFKNLKFLLNSKKTTSIQLAALTKCNVVFTRNGKITMSLSACPMRNYSATAVPLSYDVFLPETKPVSKAPIIILHAFLMYKEQWKDIGKALAIESKRKVYTLDARNHGDSPHVDDFEYPLMAEDVKLFMSSQSIPEAVIIGHSFGGRIAMLLAVTNKSFIKKLIVVDISPGTLPPQADSPHDYLKAMKDALTSIPNVGLSQGRAAVDAYLSKTIPKASVRALLLENLAERNGTLVWKPNIKVLLRVYDANATGFPSLSGCYHGDTLFICGENSQFVKPEDYPYIRTLFPKVKFVDIPNTNHFVHIQKPAEFVQTVCNFL